MSTKSKGDVLEMLTLLIERSISDQPGTTFKRNCKMEDQHGILRELDLFITTLVNGKQVQYAFECKNHKKGISLKDITDFYSKIEGRAIIGYFVTTGSYQAGAIKKAAATGIQLLTLAKRSPTKDDIKGIFVFRKQYEIVDVKFFGQSSVLDEPAVQKIFEQCEGCKRGMGRILDEMVIPYLSERVDKAIDQIAPEFSDIRTLAGTFGKEKASSYQIIAVHDKGTVITHRKEFPIQFTHTLVTIKAWHEKIMSEKIDTEHFIYNTYDNKGSGTLFSKSEFLIEDKKMVLCISRTDTTDRRMIFGQDAEILEAVPQKTFAIGKIDDYGLREIFENDMPENYEC